MNGSNAAIFFSPFARVHHLGVAPDLLHAISARAQGSKFCLRAPAVSVGGKFGSPDLVDFCCFPHQLIQTLQNTSPIELHQAVPTKHEQTPTSMDSQSFQSMKNTLNGHPIKMSQCDLSLARELARELDEAPGRWCPRSSPRGSFGDRAPCPSAPSPPTNEASKWGWGFGPPKWVGFLLSSLKGEQGTLKQATLKHVDRYEGRYGPAAVCWVNPIYPNRGGQTKEASALFVWMGLWVLREIWVPHLLLESWFIIST